MKIAFIGGGNMASAIIAAIVKDKLVKATSIVVSDVKPDSLVKLANTFSVETTDDNPAAVSGAEIIVLAVKPQNLADVGATLAGKLLPNQLVISILAGKGLKSIVESLRHDTVVRAMPNTPAQVAEGITVWTATAKVSDGQKATARRVLAAMGKEIYTPNESELDMATAISGSGPAYFFLFMKALADAGTKLGLSAPVSRELALQTARGSAIFAQSSDKSLEELRRMVTSPGGTTAEALKVFDDHKLNDIIAQATAAAYRRAVELSG